MPTATFLSNATVNITVSAVTTDLSDQCTGVVIEAKKVMLRSTAMGDTAEKFTAGLQDNTVTLSLYNSYGAGEVEAILYSAWGVPATLVISPSGTTESATNPEWTITDAYLESITPINSTVGELSAVQAVFRGGVATRDIVTP